MPEIREKDAKGMREIRERVQTKGERDAKRKSKGTRKKAKRKRKRARKECREIRERVQTKGGKSTKRKSKGTRNQRGKEHEGMPENMQGHRTKREKSTKRKSKAVRKKYRVLNFFMREPGSRRIPNFPDPGSRNLGSRPPDPELSDPGIPKSRIPGSRTVFFQLARIPNFDNI